MTDSTALILGVEQIVLRRLNIHARQPRSHATAVVAFQAKSKFHRPAQQPSVGRSMRIMALLASFDYGGRVLVDERSTPVGVTLDAGFIIERGLVHHRRTNSHAPRGGKGAVGIMTVPAIHEALVHAVLGRHIELRAHARVTSVARLAAALLQEEFRAGRMMDGMTIGAHYVVQSVCRTLDVGFLQILGVALEARFQDLLGLHERKGVGNGVASPAGRHMILPRTVTSLAARSIGWQIAGGDRLVVWVFIKRRPDVRMTDFTNVTPEVTVASRRSLCVGGKSGHE